MVMKIIGFDTETVTDNTGIPQFLSFQAYSPELRLNLFSLRREEIRDLFRKRTRNAVFMAMNAEYDALIISKVLVNEGFRLRFYYSKSRFLKAIIDDGNRNIWRIYDLANYFGGLSLAKIGRIVGLRKLKRPKYLGTRRPIGWEWDYFKSYAMRDAEICYYAGRLVRDFFGELKHSTPSLSIRKFRRECPKFADEHEHNWKFRRFFMGAYRGGRCECFIRGHIDDRIYYYDVNGMYAWAMRDNEFPLISEGYREKSSVDLDKEGIARAWIKVDAEIPPIGVKRWVEHYTPSGVKKRVQKLIFPKGRFEVFSTYPELRYLEERGLGRIERVRYAIEIGERAPVFREYVQRLMELRARLKAERNPMQKLCKLAINSIYGKLGQLGEGYQVFVSKSPQIDLMGEWTRGFKRGRMKGWLNANSNYLWASYITAYARLNLHEKLMRAGEPIYCDTDSVITTRDLGEGSKAYGELKLEHTWREGLFFRAKFYALKGERSKVVARGIFVMLSYDELRERIIWGLRELRKDWMLRFRDALRRNKVPLQRTVRRIRLNPYEDGKRNYYKHLNHLEVLLENTESEPLEVRG